MKASIESLDNVVASLLRSGYLSSYLAKESMVDQDTCVQHYHTVINAGGVKREEGE